MFRWRLGSWECIDGWRGRLDRRDWAISRVVSGASASARSRLVDAAQSVRRRAGSARGIVEREAVGLVVAKGRRGRLTSVGDKTLFGGF